MAIYFAPGCDVKRYRPEHTQKMLKFLQTYEQCEETIPLCCKVEQELQNNPTLITACPGCQRRFSEERENTKTISLWEVIDQNKSFPLPHYEGKKLAIHDPCLMEQRPEVHQAVRSLAENMGITVVEPEKTRENTECCTDSENPEHLFNRAAQMPCPEVLVYCMGCYEAMNTGGKRAIFLLDLLMGDGS